MTRLSICLLPLALLSAESAFAQSPNVPQQTNGRGAIGVNCRPEGNGCRIARITKSGPAEQAGLRVGDLLLRLNPSDHASVVEQIAKNTPGTKITLPIQRGSEHIQVQITVEDQLAVALRGAALGDPSAEDALGAIYRSGLGVPKNPAEAFKWYRKAAEQGLDTAEYAMAWMYEHSEGVPKDDAAAADWYRKSADQGYAPAQLLLGAMYVQGRSLPKNDKVAAEWFRKAADQGIADAQNELGTMYASGVGVAQDYQAAAEWYRKAAEKGDATAQYNLGFCYELGRGVQKDLATAVAWYKKAADQGLEPAKEKLAKVPQSAFTCFFLCVIGLSPCRKWVGFPLGSANTTFRGMFFEVADISLCSGLRVCSPPRSFPPLRSSHRAAEAFTFGLNVLHCLRTHRIC